MTIDKFKSGLVPPDDFPMQDLDENTGTSEPDLDTVSVNSVGSANGVPAPGLKKKKGRNLFARKKVSTFEDLCQKIYLKLYQAPYQNFAA